MKVLSINKEHSFSDEKIAFNIEAPLEKEVIDIAKAENDFLFDFGKNDKSILIIEIGKENIIDRDFLNSAFDIITKSERAFNNQRNEENSKKEKNIQHVSSLLDLEIK